MTSKCEKLIEKAVTDAIERCALACKNHAIALREQSKNARKEGRYVSADLLHGKADTADQCVIFVRALGPIPASVCASDESVDAGCDD